MDRSEMMARVRAKDTAPELMVRKMLHSFGFRFRLHQKTLPGKPDIVLPKYSTVIFVNGCFWHSHTCKKGQTKPKSNADFWNQKINDNVERDCRNKAELHQLGWKVIEVWECQAKNTELLTETLSELLVNKKDMA